MTVERRLEALRPAEGAGEWLDVQRRARTQLRRRRIGWALVTAAAAVLLAVPTIAVGDKLGVFDLSPSREDIPKPESGPVGYVFGDILSVGGQRPHTLAAPLDPRFLGPDAAVAIPSADGKAVVYHAWRAAGIAGGTPILRIYDLDPARDTILAEGAQTAAWHRDGRLAYTQALDRSYADTPTSWTGGQYGHVVVRSSRAARPRRWTTEPSLYRVHAWAGPALIVEEQEPGRYRGVQPPSPRRLVAIDGPAHVRPLPLSGFIAVSPDGRLVIGAVENRVRRASFLRVVDAESGGIVAELDVRSRIRLTGGQVLVQPQVSYEHFGSWAGTTIATVVSAGEGNQLVVYGFLGGRLRPRRSFRIDRDTLQGAGVRGVVLHAFGHPRFVGPDDSELIVPVNIAGSRPPGRSMVLTCQLETERCRVGRSFDALDKRLALLENPSRPLPSRSP